MTTNCVLCEENAQGAPLYSFPESEERRRKWLDAIGKNDVPHDASLCSQHFRRSCFAGSVLREDAVPTIFLLSERSDCEPSNARPVGTDQSQQQSGTRHALSVARPTIRRRRVHMLSDEEMKEMQPQRYVRYLKSVDWDEISKLPAEAKIAWEVAMEELKEGNDKIKELQAHVRQLKATVRKLKGVLKARTKKRAEPVRRH